MKKTLFLTIAICLVQNTLAMEGNGNENALIAVPDDNEQIAHYFLNDHARFQALWGALPKSVSNKIAQYVIAPALPMLRNSIKVPATTLETTGSMLAASGDYVRVAKFNEAGSIVATKGPDYLPHQRYMWDTETGKKISAADNLNLYDQLDLAHHQNNNNLVDQVRGIMAKQTGNDVKICSIETDKCIHELKGHTNRINSIEYNHNKTLLATASDDGSAKVWDPAYGACLLTFQHASPVKSTQFNKDGSLLITTSNNYPANPNYPRQIDCMRVWNTKTGSCICAIPFTEEQRASLLDFNSEGTLVAIQRPVFITGWNGGHYHPSDKVQIMRLEQYCKLMRFIKGDPNKTTLNLEQAMLINFIFQHLFTHELLFLNKGIPLYPGSGTRLVWRSGPKFPQKFNLNLYPHLQPYLESLPLEIQEALHPFIVPKDDSTCTVQ